MFSSGLQLHTTPSPKLQQHCGYIFHRYVTAEENIIEYCTKVILSAKTEQCTHQDREAEHVYDTPTNPPTLRRG